MSASLLTENKGEQQLGSEASVKIRQNPQSGRNQIGVGSDSSSHADSHHNC
jgi:hypothetical protein